MAKVKVLFDGKISSSDLNSVLVRKMLRIRKMKTIEDTVQYLTGGRFVLLQQFVNFASRSLSENVVDDYKMQLFGEIRKLLE
ncbi:11838_t:CDS:2, partial [Paraglomus brasilianum]